MEENKELKYQETIGALPYLRDIRDYYLEMPVTAAQEFPEKFELKTPRIKNQLNVGSCVAHALAEVIEYHNTKQEGITAAVSTGFIYGNRRNSLNKSSGMYVREALHNTCKYGDVFKEDFIENVETPKAIELFEERFDKLAEKAYPNRFSTYFRLTSDDEIKYTLMNYGPVVFAMTWYEGTKVNSNGIMEVNTKNKKEGGHCMIIYGWNKDGWLIQNSWGSFWGKSGRAVLPFDVKMSEAWGITDEVTSENPDIVKPHYNTTFKRFIAKILNVVLNLFKKKL